MNDDWKGRRSQDECTSHKINLLSFLRVVTSLFLTIDWKQKSFHFSLKGNSNKINELRGSALEFGLKESHCSDRNFLPLLRNRAHEKQKSVTIENCTMILISEDHSSEEWVTRLFMMMRLHLFSTFPLNSEAFSSHAKHSESRACPAAPVKFPSSASVHTHSSQWKENYRIGMQEEKETRARR